MELTNLALERAAWHARAFLAGLDDRPVAAKRSVAALRSALGGPLPDRGAAPSAVIDELVAATEGGHVGSASGRFFAWVIGGALPSALAADWLASTWDENATLAASAPAAAVVEEIAGLWVKTALKLPPEASFAFTTGCQMAHLTCLAAARHRVLATVGWNVEVQGLFGAPRVRVLANEGRHGSVERALRFLGFGTGVLEPLETDPSGRVRPAALEAALRLGTGPAILVVNAADLNIGAIDDLKTLAPLARASGVWVHVDGAFGLWARASRAHARLAEGLELADSWATDAHKWLNTPQDSGIAIILDVEAHRACMTHAASYLGPPGEARDAMDWTPEWSRRARGYAVYAALRELGCEGLEALIDRCCDHARALCAGLGRLPGAEVVASPTLNQGLVRFRDADCDEPAAHDRRTDQVIAAANATGEAFFSGATWRGMRVMRLSVVNWRTGANDVERAIQAVASALEAGGGDDLR